MKNSEIKIKVLNDIKQSKLKAEAEADKNLELAFKDEEFKSNYKEIKKLKFDIAKKEFAKKDTNKDKILLKELTEKLKVQANKLGYKFSDFRPNYYCKKCNDKGIINDLYCDCYYKKLNEALINNLGINVDKSHTFSNVKFDIFDKPNEIKKVYSHVQSWCEKLDSTKYKNVVLSGDTGVGKTYLLDCVCNGLVQKNIVVNYFTAFALNDLFLKYRSSFLEENSSLLDGVINCDVLIVDDLGSEPNLKNNEEYFYLLFNERIVKNKFTIISTNLSLEGIRQRYGERTFSRLANISNSLAIKMINSDLRTEIKKTTN